MKSAALILAAGLCVAGCSSDQGSSSQMSSNQNPNANNVQPSDQSQNNEAVNAGSRQYPNNQANPVQGQSTRDLQMTSDIHKRISEQNLMSMNAPNVQVITSNGYVTLTGSVPSEQDRVAVGRAAREIAGDNNVDNEVQVTKSY